MPNTKEIELIINQIKRSLNYAEKGMIEISVGAATEILDVLIAYISDNKNKAKTGTNDKATDKQLAFIRDIEEFVDEKFYGETKKEASEYIDRNYKTYRLFTMDDWALQYM